MKTKLITSLLMAPAIAFAQVPPPAITSNYGQQTLAVVTYVTPIYEQIVVGQNCQQTAQPQPQQTSGFGQVIGLVAGVAIGSRFGHGVGRTGAMVVGGYGGAQAGDAIERSNQGYGHQQQVVCTPITQARQTTNSYIAEYNGMKFSGMTYRPLRIGDTVYVNVVTSINPAE